MSAFTILIIGATGSIGRLTVEEAIAQGYRVRALVRNPLRALLSEGVDVVVGDLTKPETLAAATAGVDGVIFTHGVEDDQSLIEPVFYGGVLEILRRVAGRRVRVVLMSSIGITAREGVYSTGDISLWKRRAERLVRSSGQAYTVVRPSWFDANPGDHEQLVLRQGDTHHAGGPSDGAVSRRQIAQVLAGSLRSEAAERKTFELASEKGAASTDLDALFAGLVPDKLGELDGPLDADNLPLDTEPRHIVDDLIEVRLTRP